MVNFVQSLRFCSAITFFLALLTSCSTEPKSSHHMMDGRQFCASLNYPTLIHKTARTRTPILIDTQQSIHRENPSDKKTVERYRRKAYTTIYPSAYTSGNEAYRHKRTSTPSLTFKKKDYYEKKPERRRIGNLNEGRSTHENCENQVHRQE